MLPEMAKAAGYTTIAVDNLTVQGNGRGSWFSRGFDYYSAFSYQPFGTQSTQLADRTMRFLSAEYEKQQKDKFFLFLHLWDPHTPYAPPAPFDTLHDAGPSTPASQMQQIQSLAPEYYESFLGDMKFKKPHDFDWIMAQYDGEISYADQQIGRIFDHLTSLNLWDDTIIVVMSDHGECFDEGNFWFDHHGLYDANLRVASIWRVPGTESKQSDDFVSTEDFFPTLCNLCGWPLPKDYQANYELTGKEFTASLAGQSTPARDFFVGVECTRQATLCVRTQRWKLMVPIAKNASEETVPDFYGNARDEKVLLFDLQNDPHETKNVGAEYSAVQGELLRKLADWRESEKYLNGGRDLILETPLGLPFDEFMGRLSNRSARR